MRCHQKVFKMTSILLQYPEKQLLHSLKDLHKEIAKLKSPVIQAYMKSFLHYLESTPYEILCEKYVKTFDFHGLTTLYLTYNVFKDSRKRGEALVKLRQIFNESNLIAETDELPDYVPLILEFLAETDEESCLNVLKLHLNSLKKLEEDLTKNDSDYHFLIKAVMKTAEETLKKLQAS